MRLRSHVGRAMDFSLPSNRLIVGLTGVAAIAATIIWATGGDLEVLWAPAQAFLMWGLVREIDPDHDTTAIVAALVGGGWVLAGLETIGVLAVGAMLVAARLVVNTTGRRPLRTDLIPIGVGAAAISFTTVGWVAGFGLALAAYIDDRMAPEHNTSAAIISALAAMGATGVATLARVFPQELPDIRPLVVVSIGVLALIAVIREPPQPTSKVDSKLKNPIEQRRLYAGRSLLALLIFASSIFAGPDVIAMGPAVFALALALVSGEVARVRRRRSADGSLP